MFSVITRSWIFIQEELFVESQISSFLVILVRIWFPVWNLNKFPKFVTKGLEVVEVFTISPPKRCTKSQVLRIVLYVSYEVINFCRVRSSILLRWSTSASRS
jgi:hypothetical protein